MEERTLTKQDCIKRIVKTYRGAYLTYSIQLATGLFEVERFREHYHKNRVLRMIKEAEDEKNILEQASARNSQIDKLDEVILELDAILTEIER